MPRVKVTIDQKALHHVYRSKSGPVGKHVTKMTIAVHKGARVLAPVDKGQLRNDIAWKVEETARGPKGTVYNRIKHAVFVHEGTRPHTIRPRSARVLAFPKSGRMVFAKVVRHPGTKPYRYLKMALEGVTRSFR